MGVTCRGHEHLAFAKHTLDALHPQAQLAGEDLETLVLASMYVVRTGSPAGRADPIHLEQLTPVSRAVLRNTVLSPVTGFISSAPALAMPCPPLLLSVSDFPLPAEARPKPATRRSARSPQPGRWRFARGSTRSTS